MERRRDKQIIIMIAAIVCVWVVKLLRNDVTDLFLKNQPAPVA